MKSTLTRLCRIYNCWRNEWWSTCIGNQRCFSAFIMSDIDLTYCGIVINRGSAESSFVMFADKEWHGRFYLAYGIVSSLGNSLPGSICNPTFCSSANRLKCSISVQFLYQQIHYGGLSSGVLFLFSMDIFFFWCYSILISHYWLFLFVWCWRCLPKK